MPLITGVAIRTYSKKKAAMIWAQIWAQYEHRHMIISLYYTQCI